MVASDVKHISINGGTIGLNLNFIKCEQTSDPVDQFSHCTINNASLYLAHLSYQVLQWT